MRVGARVSTLPTVRPKLYAGRVGTVAIKNDGEVGVLIAGRVVWFLEREIEGWNGSSSSVSVRKSVESAREQDGSSPLSQSTPRDARTSSCTDQGGAASGKGDGNLGAQERAREGQGVGARVPRPPRGEPEGPQEVTAIDSEGVDGPEGESSPKPLSRPSRGSGEDQELILGERGPAGGVVARCEGCSGLWERPKQRGRPSLKCPRCR